MAVTTTTRYPNIVRAVFSRPWAIEPQTLGLVLDILRFRVDGGRFTPDEIEARIASASHGPRANPTYAASRNQRRSSDDEPKPAIIPVYGVISQRQNLMAADSGGTSIEGLTQDFRAAMADPSVSGILFEFDSPGGTIDGVDELASEIRAARGGDKPIVAVANSLAASAAYWLASQADELVVIPSGTVGSIGVFAAHEDLSAQAEMDGVKTTLVSAGKYKTEGNPWEPLGEDARAHLQELVNAHYDMMVGSIAKGRQTSVGAVRDGMGEGRTVLPRKALDANMVDRIDTLDNTYNRMLRGKITPRSSATRAEGDRLMLAASNGSNEESTNDEELGTARPFAERLALVTADADALLAHAQDRVGMRAVKGRSLSPADRAGLRAVATSLNALAGDDQPDDEPEPAPQPTAPPAGMTPKARVALALAKAELRI